MDWQIRIALIVLGIFVIGFIVYDFNRRKKAQTEKQRLIDQMRRASEHVDASGFDFTGVGSARPAGSKDNEQPADKHEAPQTLETNQVTENDTSEKNVTTEDAVEKTTASTAKQSPTEQMSLQTDVPPQQPEIVVSLILQAEEFSYKGKDFMPLVLSQGLRHGEMGIFHRHTGAAGKPGPVMYSVANAIKPGTFELTNIESFETPAFAFFMTVPGPEDPIAAFEGMVKTIKMFKQELGGQILDDTKSVYTEQTYQHQLDNLREYVTKASLKS